MSVFWGEVQFEYVVTPELGAHANANLTPAEIAMPTAMSYSLREYYWNGTAPSTDIANWALQGAELIPAADRLQPHNLGALGAVSANARESFVRGLRAYKMGELEEIGRLLASSKEEMRQATTTLADAYGLLYSSAEIRNALPRDVQGLLVDRADRLVTTARCALEETAKKKQAAASATAVDGSAAPKKPEVDPKAVPPSPAVSAMLAFAGASGTMSSSASAAARGAGNPAVARPPAISAVRVATESPEMLGGLLRIESVEVQWDSGRSNDNDDLVDNREFETADEIRDYVALTLGVNRELVEVAYSDGDD